MRFVTFIGSRKPGVAFGQLYGGKHRRLTGVRKTIWFHEDEAEALRRFAFEERKKESEIVREAVRRFLGIED